VGQQEPVEPPECGVGPEQLTLRALPAIDQDPIAAGFHQEPGMVSLRRWDAGRGSEKSQVEHVRTVIRKYGGLLWRRLPCELYLERTSPYSFVEEALGRFSPARLRADRCVGRALFLSGR